MILFLTQNKDKKSFTRWGETDNKEGFYKIYDYLMKSTHPEDFLLYDTVNKIVIRMVDYKDDRKKEVTT